MKDLINQILKISSGLLMLTIVISFFLYSFSIPKTAGCGTKTPQLICGTVSLKLTENAQIGKQIFNANCAACHKLNRNMTGPALAKTDSTLLWNWMTLNKQKIDSSKIRELGVDYHRSFWANSLTQTELIGLYEYINAD